MTVEQLSYKAIPIDETYIIVNNSDVLVDGIVVYGNGRQGSQEPIFVYDSSINYEGYYILPLVPVMAQSRPTYPGLPVFTSPIEWGGLTVQEAVFRHLDLQVGTYKDSKYTHGLYDGFLKASFGFFEEFTKTELLSFVYYVNRYFETIEQTNIKNVKTIEHLVDDYIVLIRKPKHYAIEIDINTAGVPWEKTHTSNIEITIVSWKEITI